MKYPLEDIKNIKEIVILLKMEKLRKERKIIGKVKAADLERFVFQRLGQKDKGIALGPRYGEDAAAIRLSKEDLVVTADPIVFSLDRIGKLGINVVCNDLAACGVQPRWILDILFLPERGGRKALDKITKQLDSESKKLKVAIVGGHSEYVPGLERPFIALMAMGTAKRNQWVKTGGAKPGDIILLTKSAGLEVSGIIATELADYLKKKGVTKTLLKKLAHNLDKISVVKEAMLVRNMAQAMHDPTEGGVLAGLQEIARSSRVDIEIWENEIPIRKEVRAISKIMGINPLKCFSSGSLLLAVKKKDGKRVLTILRRHRIPASIIGKVLRKSKNPYLYFHRQSGQVEKIRKTIKDEFYSVWDKYKT